jgi:hypothetical protein
MSGSAASARRSRQSGNPVALFPFLAVLVCTMGALIVVLLVLARQSRIQAAQAVTAKATELQSDLDAARKISEWRRSDMAASGQRAQAKLTETRLQLAHIEEHSRQLREQLAQLDAQWKELQQLKSHTGRRQEDLAAERARLAAQIAEADRRLAQAEKDVRERPKSYAIVPYEGPNGTRRRPLYVECRHDAIVLQPEGIVLRESDFPDPLGPGNPLDTALRAARESLLAQKEIRGDGSDEPYPLLLVRPGGTVAYYVARQALKSWRSEIGYELIGEDWKLEFPQPNAHVAQSVQEAVELARGEQRQKAMLAALVSAARPRTTYRAAPRGGLIREGGPDEEEEEDPSSHGGKSAALFGSGFRDGAQGGPARAAQSSSASPAGSAAALGPTDGDPKSASKAGQPLRPGEWIPLEDSPEPKVSKKEKRKDPEKDEPSSKAKSLAANRGRNWGLPDAARGSAAITRPIRVDCFPDQLVILPEPGAGRSQAIPLGARTEDSIDSFISAVWEHLKGWGIAGRGMYWRPVLKVGVAPGAEGRYLELKALLQDSGLQVERREGTRDE